jgi:phage FluMu gp28-like protein
MGERRGHSLAAQPQERGQRLHRQSLVILDEFAKNPNAAQLYTAVKPTIDGGGKMIILSTANGAGNLFHEMVEKAQAVRHDLPSSSCPGKRGRGVMRCGTPA